MIEPRIQQYLRRFQDKQLHKPTHCQVCKKPGPLRWHGGYVRTLITLAKVHHLPIRRLLCAACHHTFAFLPDFICKFHRYAKEVIQSALAWLKFRTYEAVAEKVANHTADPSGRGFAVLTLHFWRRKFV